MLRQRSAKRHGALAEPGNTNASCPRRRSRSGIKLSGHTQRVLSLKEWSSTEQSSTFIKQLSLALDDIFDENTLNEP